jgi:hypothetical protein
MLLPMFDGLARDRRAERREATRLEILAAAWQLVCEQGLTGLTLGDGFNPGALIRTRLMFYTDLST